MNKRQRQGELVKGDARNILKRESKKSLLFSRAMVRCRHGTGARFDLLCRYCSEVTRRFTVVKSKTGCVMCRRGEFFRVASSLSG